MAPYGFPIITPNGSLWLPKAPYGSIWLHITPFIGALFQSHLINQLFVRPFVRPSVPVFVLRNFWDVPQPPSSISNSVMASPQKTFVISVAEQLLAL
jgi:hypothetical protein